MKRILSIFLPSLLADIKQKTLRKTNKLLLESPCLFYAPLHNENIVFRYCARARHCGVYSGIPLTQALPLVPQAQLFLFDQTHEEKLLTRLARWAYSFSPFVYFDQRDYRANLLDIRLSGIALDLTGSLRMFGGEETLLTKITNELKGFSLNARCAIASTYGAAWALARYAKTVPFSATLNNLETELLKLPIAALRIDRALESSLRELHINDIGELVKIPKAQLLIRFGPELATKLEQLFSFSAPQTTFINTEPKTALARLDTPLDDKRIIERYCCSLLKTILQEKLPPYSALLKLKLTFKLLSGEQLAPTIALNTPTRKETHLAMLIHLKIQNINFVEAVKEIGLTVEQDAILTPQNEVLLAGSTSTGQQKRGPLLDLLTESLSVNRIYRLRIYPSYFPERALCYDHNDTTAPPPPETIPELLRPSLILDKPQEISTISLLPDHPPQLLAWNNVRYKVTHSLGPERLSTEWWNLPSENTIPFDRDYFSLKLESGLWLWVYREAETSRWFLQGLWA